MKQATITIYQLSELNKAGYRRALKETKAIMVNLAHKREEERVTGELRSLGFFSSLEKLAIEREKVGQYNIRLCIGNALENDNFNMMMMYELSGIYQEEKDKEGLTKLLSSLKIRYDDFNESSKVTLYIDESVRSLDPVYDLTRLIKYTKLVMLKVKEAVIYHLIEEYGDIRTYSILEFIKANDLHYYEDGKLYKEEK